MGRAGVAQVGSPGLKHPQVQGVPARAILAESAPAAGPGESSPGKGRTRGQRWARGPCSLRVSGQRSGFPCSEVT